MSIQQNFFLVQVITDGLRTEVIASQVLRGRACGLCGDLNGENTADLVTPKFCVMKKDKFAAYSYMINERQCNGIPSEDREEYERQIRKCVKKEEIKTPLENVYDRLQQLSKPTTSVHLVKKQANQICISRERINVCPQQQKNNQQRQQHNSNFCSSRMG